MLKESYIADSLNLMLLFSKLTTFGLNTVLLRSILNFRKDIFRMKLRMKRLQNDANKICITFTALWESVIVLCFVA